MEAWIVEAWMVLEGTSARDTYYNQRRRVCSRPAPSIMEEAIHALTERKIRELLALVEVRGDKMELPRQHVSGIVDFGKFAWPGALGVAH